MFFAAADALVATIAFFDLFDIALSSAEVWTYCASHQGAPHCLSDIEGLLRNDPRLARRDGLWMLAGRQDLSRMRVARGFSVHERWAIAVKAARFAAFVPFLHLFAVCNTLGYGVAKEQSDIDVLVIAGRKRIWTTRFLLTAILQLARLRRHNAVISRRICLSFYITTDALTVAALAIDPLDPYLAWWVGSVVPLVDRGAYADFVTANRPLVERYRKESILRDPPPLVIPSHPSVIPSQAKGSRTAHFFEYLLSGHLGDLLESFLRFTQLQKIQHSSLGKIREHPTSVVISDHVLKFHENDRRAALRDAWRDRLRELGIMIDFQSVIPSSTGGSARGGSLSKAEGSRIV